MKTFFNLLILFSCFNVCAQKIEKFYTWEWKETDISHARFYCVIKKSDSLWHRQDYFIHERKLQMDGYYDDSSCKIQNGMFYYFHPNGSLEMSGQYIHGKKEGLWVSYHSNKAMSDSGLYIDGRPAGTCMKWYANGYPADSIIYYPDGTAVEAGWFDNGAPSYSGKYADKKKNGKWQYFHKNGKLSAIETYSDNNLITKEYFDENGNPQADTTNNDRKAEYPGGMKAWQKYLSKHLYFPDQYKIVNADEAVVVITMLIDEEGNIADAEVSTPFYPVFDNIALSVVKKSGKWIPARNHNRTVQYRFNQSIVFSQIPD